MYQRVLVATDLSDQSRRITRRAWEVANHFDAKLFLVHVVEPIPAYGHPEVSELESPHIDKAKKQMIALAEDLCVPRENQFVCVGHPKAEILKKVKEHDIDLIIIGSHGRHGLTHMLGSTANAILHGAPCDVVTVRAKA